MTVVSLEPSTNFNKECPVHKQNYLKKEVTWLRDGLRLAAIAVPPLLVGAYMGYKYMTVVPLSPLNGALDLYNQATVTACLATIAVIFVAVN